MEYQDIAYEVEDRIATITLNRPDKLNAFTSQMMIELIDAFERVDADDEVRVVIVTGRGRGFCAGADLSEGAATFDQHARGRSENIEEHRDGGGLVTLRIFDCKKPVIAAINGPAVGVGITMTHRPCRSVERASTWPSQQEFPMASSSCAGATMHC